MVYQPPPKVPTYQYLLGELQKVRGENRDLKEFNRNLRQTCEDRGIAMDKAESRVAELEEELRNIADADYTKWADDMNTPSNFVMWAKSRARHTLNLK